MKTTSIPIEYQHRSPAGAEVRLLMSNHLGGMAHCTLRKGVISHAIYHTTVAEFWFIVSGQGAIWRKNDQDASVTPLHAGISIDIPLGTEFQYRSDDEDLVFICVTMPPWSGPDEACYTTGAWTPTASLR